MPRRFVSFVRKGGLGEMDKSKRQEEEINMKIRAISSNVKASHGCFISIGLRASSFEVRYEPVWRTRFDFRA